MRNIFTFIFVCTLFANMAHSSSNGGTGETITKCEQMNERSTRVSKDNSVNDVVENFKKKSSKQ